MRVTIDLPGGIADRRQGKYLREGRMDHSHSNEPISFPRLSVVRKMTSCDPLEPHPQMAIIVWVVVAGGGGTSNDRAPGASHKHACSERIPTRMFNHYIRAVAPR